MFESELVYQSMTPSAAEVMRGRISVPAVAAVASMNSRLFMIPFSRFCLGAFLGDSPTDGLHSNTRGPPVSGQRASNTVGEDHSYATGVLHVALGNGSREESAPQVVSLRWKPLGALASMLERDRLGAGASVH